MSDIKLVSGSTQVRKKSVFCFEIEMTRFKQCNLVGTFGKSSQWLVRSQESELMVTDFFAKEIGKVFRSLIPWGHERTSREQDFFEHRIAS